MTRDQNAGDDSQHAFSSFLHALPASGWDLGATVQQGLPALFGVRLSDLFSPFVRLKANTLLYAPAIFIPTERDSLSPKDQGSCEFRDFFTLCPGRTKTLSECDLVYDAGVRAPICFNPPAAKEELPYYELRSKLGMEGKTPDQIRESVQAAFAKGQLPRRDEVSFAYMWSADQNLGTGIGHWHPHMMIFAP
jgi:hypothetical protein